MAKTENVTLTGKVTEACKGGIFLVSIENNGTSMTVVSKTGEYLSFDKMVEVCKELNIPIVNVLYRGPFAKELPDQYADGKSTYADHTREGCVIASTGEKRKKFKHVGQEYLLKIA
jgi:hypothetical protein